MTTRDHDQMHQRVQDQYLAAAIVERVSYEGDVELDGMWQDASGAVFYQTSPRGRSMYDPPDTTVYRARLVDKDVGDVARLMLEVEEVEWIDGTKHNEAERT